jgi:hypothetical protein
MDRYERRCRELVRFAYPRRFRAQREAEVVGVLLDLREPGRDRVPVTVWFDVLVGGLRYRVENRPPFYPWLAYRLFDSRLPGRYRAWVRDDVEGWSYPLRRQFAMMWIVIVALLAMSGLTWIGGGQLGAIAAFPGWFLPTYVVLGLVGGFVTRRRLRRDARRRHGLDPDPEPAAQQAKGWRPNWTTGTEIAPGPREQVWPVLVILGTASSVGAAASVVDLVVDLPGARPRITAVALLASGLGLAVARAAGRRLGRRLATRPPEPERPVLRWRRPFVLILALAAAGGTVALAVPVWTSPALDYGPLPLLALILLAGPAMLVAGLVARHAERGGGLVVTARDLVVGLFGVEDLIPPEPVLTLPGQLPAQLPAHRRPPPVPPADS